MRRKKNDQGRVNEKGEDETKLSVEKDEGEDYEDEKL